MRVGLLTLLAALPAVSLADVRFTSPAAGETLRAGSTVIVEWEDSGDAPEISQLTNYQLFLCAGGNDEGTFIQLSPLTTQGTFATGNTASGIIPQGVGASRPRNAYFLSIQSVAAEGGTIINYSPRFSISGMTGTFPPNIVEALEEVEGTDGPETVNNVVNDPGSIPDGADAGVPYGEQVGLTKYAPMQPIPPTKITAKEHTPLNTPSSVRIARDFLPKASQVTTVTASQTKKFSSIENTAAPASHPTDDMAKFLARWKD